MLLARQDWVLGRARCQCCCEEDYASFPPSHARPTSPPLLAVSPSPFVHLGRASTLAHGDARLDNVTSRAALAAFIDRRCRGQHPYAPLNLRPL